MTQRDHTLAAEALAASQCDQEQLKRAEAAVEANSDSRIKQVTKYKTVDGTEHDTIEEARAHEKDLRTSRKIQDFCELYFTTRDNDRDEISDVLFKHRRELKSILLHAR